MQRTNARTDERGIALVITMFLLAALSALAVSLMFLSQTETSSSRNYRTMSQARYGGEAGVHKAINYLYNSYTAPSSFSNYDLTKYPVTCTSGCTTTSGTCDISGSTPTGPCIVLSAMSGVTTNYPDSTVATAFNTAAQGSLANGTASVGYSAYAVLLSMRTVTVYGGGTGTVQMWKIVADGTVSGAIPATVEVMATVEQNVEDAQTYAIFATDPNCGAITMSGNEVTNSYNSSLLTQASSWSGGAVGSGHPIVSNSGGAVGTNGNLDLSGHVDVHGTLSTPRTGVGACSAGNITAETLAGSATVDNGIIPLAQAKTYPTPNPPSPLPGTATVSINSSTSCANLLAASLIPVIGVICTGTAGNLTLTMTTANTLSWGNVALSGGANLTITSTSAVNFNVNSFTMTGNSSLNLGNSSTSLVLNVAGTGIDSTGIVLDFSGGSFTNPSYDPSKFQILYAGTSELKMVGGSASAATVYAPNSYTEMHGNADFYGSVLSSRFNDTGGATVHYDTALSSKFKTLGQKVMTSFSWKKY